MDVDALTLRGAVAVVDDAAGHASRAVGIGRSDDVGMFFLMNMQK